MEVIAREWRVGSSPAGVVQVYEGSSAQREIFANVRENRYVLEQDGATSGRDATCSPIRVWRPRSSTAWPVACAGWPRRACCFYAPFAPNRLPPGVSPAAVLGTIRTSGQVSRTWATAVLRGQAPRDVIDLVEIYGAAFPAERAEVTRISW